MPWTETCAMDQRVQFIHEVQRGEYTMSDLCRMFGISRKTGYETLARFEAKGYAGLEARSRAPLHHPHAVAQPIRELLVDLRKKHGWGPVKLLDWMRNNKPRLKLPAASTVDELLRREGLIKPRRRVRRAPAYGAPYTIAVAPNDLWCADFKGWFRTADGLPCYPLTISDARSRYFLCCQGLAHATHELSEPHFERIFRKFGLPSAIRTDGGQPFASTGLGGLSALAVKWIKLGILPERIQPGCPQQNGRHERLHETLKAACPIGTNLCDQQRKFDRFVREYNHERPHQHLHGKTPGMIYRNSQRRYPKRLAQIEYPAPFEVCYVYTSGQICWRGREWYVSAVLAGEPVGLYPLDDGVWRIHFGPLAIGLLDLKAQRIQPIQTFIEIPTLH